MSLGEKDLFNWAKSEIENSSEFIMYETNSTLSTKGRTLINNTSIITRTFKYLSEVFGILNYTPDSFSDGGLYNQLTHAEKRIIDLINLGVEIIDIGVESTRPDALPLNDNEEIEYLKPVLNMAIKLRKYYQFQISIDTYHNQTATWLCDQDIQFINDVSGKINPTIVKECINANKRYIAMHSLDVPANPSHIIQLDTNPITYLSKWIDHKLNQLDKHNIDLSKIIIDPGIGFGKNSSQAWYIIKNLNRLELNGTQLLLGHSRKSFINHLDKQDIASKRDLTTALIAGFLVNHVDYLRLHDVVALHQIYPVILQLQEKKIPNLY